MPKRRRLTRPSSPGSEVALFQFHNMIAVHPPARFFDKQPLMGAPRGCHVVSNAANVINGSETAFAAKEMKHPEERNKETLKAAWEQPSAALTPTSIFWMGSPPREVRTNNQSPGEGFLEFLRNCSFCRKVFDTARENNKPLYMYGYLGAFCSHECREHRMALDRIMSRRQHPSRETNLGYGN